MLLFINPTWVYYHHIFVHISVKSILLAIASDHMNYFYELNLGKRHLNLLLPLLGIVYKVH